MKKFWMNLFRKDEEGATMVEYAIMLALIAIVCILAVVLIGTSASEVFSYCGSYLNGTI